MSRKIGVEEYNDKLRARTNTIIPVSNYIGWNKPITYKCLVCNHEWVVKEARSVIRGYRCPNCAKIKKLESLDKIHKSNLKTDEWFRNELEKKQPNLLPNDTYHGIGIKYHCICKIHKCDVYTTPEKYLYRNQGCKLCSVERSKNSIRYTHNSFCQSVKNINPKLDVMSEYINIKSRISVKCKICGHEWSPIAESLIGKTPCGCPSCAGNAIKSPTQFKNELEISHPELKLLSDYIRANKKVHVLCTDCNRDFWVTPNKLQLGQHCPYCKISHGEAVIRSILTNLNVLFEMQKKFDGLIGVGNRKLSYDFYLPDYNLLIEFQGKQHESPVMFRGLTSIDANNRFVKQKKHDKRKRDYASSNNIRLLEIWYYDIDSIEDILLKELSVDSYKFA